MKKKPTSNKFYKKKLEELSILQKTKLKVNKKLCEINFTEKNKKICKRCKAMDYEAVSYKAT